MKQLTFIFLFGTLILNGQKVLAQSFSDLFNKKNLDKVVGAVTGTVIGVDIAGTWDYTGACVEFESDDLLSKAGGTAASGIVENKFNEQLERMGIKPGMLHFTFKADSTFNCSLAEKAINGTYSYNAEKKTVILKYWQKLDMEAKLNNFSETIQLTFKADKLLQLITDLSKKSNNQTLNTIGALADGYDGMRMGVKLKKTTL